LLVTPARRAWYDLMIADEVRNAAYRKALAMYAPGRVVVDVGAGLGHLSLWALEAGASKAILIDWDDAALDEAESHTLRCFGDGTTPEVEYFGCTADSLELPESFRADVVVAEIFDSSGVGEGAIETLKDARRFLRPGGVMIPDSMRVHFCLLYKPVAGFAGKLACGVLADDAIWFDWCPGEEVGIHVQRSGDVYGFGLAFTLALAPGVSLTNLPGHPATHWKQGALPFAGPVKAERGQVWIVRGDVDHSRDRLNPDVSFNVLRIEQ
jgi:SAM-dependent methyltransferase